MGGFKNKFDYRNFAVVDLFCGIGGLTHGFVSEGFKVKAGIDFDESCRYAFEVNNNSKFVYQDITKVTGAQLERFFGKKPKILVGCAPCQPFSIYNFKKKSTANFIEKSDDAVDDEKWKLLFSFGRLIDEIKPEIVSMENVPLLLKFNNGSVFNSFIEVLERNNYNVKWGVVNAKDFNVPQSRRRLILIASRLGEIDFLEKESLGKFVTVKDAIGHLPIVEDGIHHPDDFLHRARKLTEINKKRIEATEEGGSWKSWDTSLQLDCQKNGGHEFRSVYGRMKWNDVSPTITTFCTGLNNGRFGHPSQNRAITLREAALLQSFPKEYNFIDPDKAFSSMAIARQIGNAVPVNLGVAIAKCIKKHLSTIYG